MGEQGHGGPGGRPAPWLMLGGTVAWSWVFWWLAAATGRPGLSFPTALLMIAGFVGPLVVPALLIMGGRWDEPLGRFLRRSFDPRTLPPRWWLVSLGLAVVIAAGPMAVDPGTSLTIATGPTAFLLIGFLAGAIEEPGWRGYGQAALQRRLPVLLTSVVVGLFWAAWHVPLFFVEGTYQHGLGAATVDFWVFHAVIVVSSPIYAWLYNVSAGVVFAPVLFHATGNVVGEVVGDEPHPLATVGVHLSVTLAVSALSWHTMRARLER